MGPEYYVTIMSFVDKSQLEPGCSVLLHNKVSWEIAGRSSSNIRGMQGCEDGGPAGPLMSPDSSQ